jgi:hypothetical protein
MDPAMFKDKYIALVLSCKRPYYENRRQKNQQTFDILKSSGFIVVYLFSDNSLSTIEFSTIETGKEYTMTVPLPEIYEFIGYKMNLAYDYFYNTDCKGVLKIDDNTNIIFPEVIEHDFMEIINQYDYIGLEKVSIKESKTPYICVKNRTELRMFENLYHKIKSDFFYYAGPFYYVSKKALKQISTKGIEFIYEDVGIGYALSTNKQLKNFLWNFKNIGVSWDNMTEQNQMK